MEKITCKACGGAVEQVNATQYRCLFCGTVHELTRDDGSVRELLERNNERWAYINKRMVDFYAAVNRAGGYEIERATYRARFLTFNAAAAIIAVVGAVLLVVNAPDSAGQIARGLLPLLLTFVLIGDAVIGVMWWSLRSMRDAALRDARAIGGDVLAQYREMSAKPAKDLLQSLHDPRFIANDVAGNLAARVYDDLATA